MPPLVGNLVISVCIVVGAGYHESSAASDGWCRPGKRTPTNRGALEGPRNVGYESVPLIFGGPACQSPGVAPEESLVEPHHEVAGMGC